MTMEVETIVAVSLMMAVFSAVAAVGTSIVLGAGFERLRAGFDVVRKQTGFFSDAIHKLEQKVETVDAQATSFSQAMHQMELKVTNVGEQANAFTNSVQQLEKKVEIVDKQTGFFAQAIQKLDKKIDTVDAHEQIVSDKMERHAGSDLISTGKAEALVSHAEDLLSQMSSLAMSISQKQPDSQMLQPLALSMPRNLGQAAVYSGSGGFAQEREEIRYH